ncbi:MAG TPA: TlpA disulfide reductase family protein [Pyrinomonadaceae bacterium]|nr:TlpA disulfide reductase family protein [Pyrinomonadaceae bacterium]
MKNLKHNISFLVLATVFAVSAAAQTNLTSLDGAKVDVEAQTGKVVVMAIGAAWLPLSAKQAEYTNALAKKYAGKNVVVYFVMTDSANPKSKNYTSVEDIKRFVAANKLTVTVLRDPDGAATLRKFNVDQVPSFVLLNKKGEAASEPFGGIDPKYDITIPISKAIDKLL